jgi:C4-dicarboxylate-specific signal transduction histidine kinase
MIASPPRAGEAAKPLPDDEPLNRELAELRDRVQNLESRLHKGEERRRAMLHIMSDLADSNRRLSDQRKAMLHILVDYEKDRKDIILQSERLSNSRRALMHILQDAHRTNQRLGLSRKAMIHIMGDLRQTTEEIRRREQELREKQEQLVQAAKLATLGELTTGIAHELNNPLNNIGLYLGNVVDLLLAGDGHAERMKHDLLQALQQVNKATEIISHLRTFGRAAPVVHEPVSVNEVVQRSLSLLKEQLRLRQIEVRLLLDEREPHVMGNPIQLEQVFMNLLTNARDAVASARSRRITISSTIEGSSVRMLVADTGPGIPDELAQRIFDPFFTTKDVGEGTGLGLSIVYGIIKEHEGSIAVENTPGKGATFIIDLPLGG